MNNVLAILGSPNKNGKSAELLNIFLAENNVKNIRKIYAYDEFVAPCIDCKKCKEQNRLCVINDKMASYYEDIFWADTIIVATPIYYNSVPMPLKGIFDRTMCLYCKRFIHNEKPEPKKGIVILTCGSKSDFGVECVKSQIKMFLDVCGAVIKREIIHKNTDKS